MKILIINKYWYRRGGADVYAMWLAESLKKRGHKVVVFTVDWNENERIKYPHETISPIQTEKLRPWSAPRTIGRMLWSFEAQRKLKAFIEKHKPDVAHLHNIYTQMSPSILPVLKKSGIPTVSHVHDYGMISANYSLYDDKGIDRLGNWSSVVLRNGVKRSKLASIIGATIFGIHRRLRVYDYGINRLIFTTDFVRRVFIGHGWRGDRGTIIPYVVNLHGEEKKPQEDEKFFFFAGRLHKTKGVDVLIEAARKTGLPLKIAGGGPDAAMFKRQAEGLPNVHFLGSLPREDVLDYMRRARAVVVPSTWWEPFGLVALEPQGLATPVIASKTGGLQEVVVDGVTGMHVKPNSVQDLARAMEYLHKNPNKASHMGMLGKRRVETQFNADVHLDKIEAVYRSLV